MKNEVNKKRNKLKKNNNSKIKNNLQQQNNNNNKKKYSKTNKLASEKQKNNNSKIKTNLQQKNHKKHNDVKTSKNIKNNKTLKHTETIHNFILFLLTLVVLFLFLFLLDLLTNKERFEKVDKEINLDFIKLDAKIKIEDYVGENNELSDFYLNLMGYDNSNQVTHPKVIKFNKKWNGYRYWIAYTPYPFGNQAKENPFIMVSNDLVNWKTKDNFNNPLDEPEDKDSYKVYNSDTHLLYNPDTNTLECYWRYVNNKTWKVIVYKMTTKDGVKWTDKEIFLESDRRREDYLSPAIIYKNNKYLVWFVDRDFKVRYTEYDTLKKEWTSPRTVNINYKNNKLKSWHLDVIETDHGYEMIVVAFLDFSNRGNMSLYYTKSKDNETWDEAKEILHPNEQSGLYRSSILYDNNTYYIFYSDIVKKARRGIGIVYGSDINNLSGLKYKNKEKFIDYVKFNN